MKESVSVDKLNSRILKYRFYDKSHGAVIYYTLDLDKYQLSIQGETTGAYKWVETQKTESFIDLMLRCDMWYLANKLFKKVLDLNRSLNKIAKYIKECDLFPTKVKERNFIRELKEIDVDCQNCLMIEVNRLLGEYEVSVEDDYELWCCIEKQYKYWDEKAVSYFCRFIKPQLRKESDKVKAWLAYAEGDFCQTIVFAKTRGKARAIAKYTDACEDSDFCNIVVSRLPKADKYYKEGKIQFDWDNPQDRLILVKEFDFTCETTNEERCEECSAKEHCIRYSEEKDWENENEAVDNTRTTTEKKQ